MELISCSQKLLEDTIAGNAEAVAQAIGKICDKLSGAALETLESEQRRWEESNANERKKSYGIDSMGT